MSGAKRKIGQFEVAPIGLGCMSLSRAYGVAASPEDADRLLNRALDIGYDFLDTATIYGEGDNERAVGRALKGRRREFVLASKGGIFADGPKRWVDCRPETIAASIDASLARLGFDHIDLYYLHRLDFTVPVEESVGALKRAVEAGKIGAIGLSEVSAETLRRAHAEYPVAAVQNEYSLWTRNPEIALAEACRELGTCLVAFSPVGRGLLAGGVADAASLSDSDMRKAMPRFIEPQFSSNLKLLDAFRAIGRELGHTPAQLALAWLLNRDDRLTTIPGTASIDHLEENLAAASIGLSAETMGRVDALINERTVQGKRYGPAMQATSDAEEFA